MRQTKPLHPYQLMTEKTNLGLVAYCKSKMALPTIYMLSGFGRILNAAVKSHFHSVDHRVYTLKCAHTIRNEARIRQGIGRYCFDCVGLIKGYLWELSPGSINYKTINGVYFPDSDNDVRGMWTRALKKGSYSAMPDVPGILVMTADFGHVGVYIGRVNGVAQFIEATPGLGIWGVGQTNSTNRTWTYWAEHYLIKYIAPVVKPVAGIGYYEIVRGDSLSRIAGKFNSTIAELLEMNPKRIVDPNLITEGAIIKVPVTEMVVPPTVIIKEVEKIVIKEVEKIVIQEVPKAYSKVLADEEVVLTLTVQPK